MLCSAVGDKYVCVRVRVCAWDSTGWLDWNTIQMDRQSPSFRLSSSLINNSREQWALTAGRDGASESRYTECNAVYQCHSTPPGKHTVYIHLMATGGSRGHFVLLFKLKVFSFVIFLFGFCSNWSKTLPCRWVKKKKVCFHCIVNKWLFASLFQCKSTVFIHPSDGSILKRVRQLSPVWHTPVSLPLRVYFPRQPCDSSDAVGGRRSDPTLSHRRSSHSFTGRTRMETQRKGDKHRLFRGQKYNMDLKRGQHFSSAQPWLLPSTSERQSFLFWGPLWNGPCCIVGWVQSIR